MRQPRTFSRIITSVAASFLLVGSMQFTSAFADEIDQVALDRAGAPQSTEETEKEIDRYIITDDDGVMRFDMQTAQQEGASETALRAGTYINEFTSTTSTRGIIDSFMNKWRYCGPNNSQPGPPYAGKPADSACRDHDICLAQNTDLNAKKACDQALINATQHELDENSGAYSLDERAYLHAMKRAISWARDNCRVDSPPAICKGKLR